MDIKLEKKPWYTGTSVTATIWREALPSLPS